ncbi:MAG: nickel pincer cofactor biosynthesis protein LarB, partial [Janthinobacterium lividum]
MRRDALLALLDELQAGKHTSEDVADRLASLPFEDLGFANVDHHRSLRSGLPEVVFAAGKTPEQTATILSSLHASGVPALATRADAAAFAATQQLLPKARYHEAARCITCGDPAVSNGGHIAVVCAGTSDLPVAEEASVTAEFFGTRVTRITDVGVAGLHRLLANLPAIREADTIVVCAGMEGALPSVVGGLVAVPVIAVPTSVGYGAAFGGVTALLGMLNSCSPNVTVVNIDNGFGAG